MEADKLVIMKSGLVKLMVSITRTGGTSVSEEEEDEEEDEVDGLEATRLLTGCPGWSICGK